ncbi:MAG: chromosome segregation protein SMC [Betaproteobacteria bacterium]|jgi:chromosome segregation protein
MGFLLSGPLPDTDCPPHPSPVRLTHIKLAGFKSFVDPTHIALPGKLVGVVGPNGCGKSNVIDAVRWVLGESSARHLRGESMEDVIFNGSGDRRPANRASVELVFDNSLGKAAGAWSQYAEIAIKRVLERDGQSTYFINNTAVRRRDVTDIFLGTGLGARAYAIVEQGMISRVVEAKPEELRVFLEEAAGVSRYRDRRKETEARLDDTRENLLRVDDIRGELKTQIAHLEAQAEAAERYRDLEARLRRTQHLLWTIRRDDAATARLKAAREIESLTVQIEESGAALRDADKRMESLREEHYAAGEAVHAAQGQLYETNAELARVEQGLQFLRTNRDRALSRRDALATQIAEQTARHAQLDAALAQARQRRVAAEATAAQHAETATAAREALPAAEQAYREARARAEAAQQALAAARGERDVAATRRSHAERVMAQLDSRRQRLSQELASTVLPDAGEVERLKAQGGELETQLSVQRTSLQSAEAALPAREAQLQQLAHRAQELQQRYAALDARRHALSSLQQQVGASEQMSAWLGQHGLSNRAKLWQKVRVRPGWEDALEAVLRERLNAIQVDEPAALSDWFGASPPGKLAVYRADAGSGTQALPVAPAGLERLLDCVETDDPGVRAVLGEWLDGVFAAPSAPLARAAAAQLAPGESVVAKEGHLFTPRSAGFHAPDSEIHGLLERKREIEQLDGELPPLEAQWSDARREMAAGQAELAEQRKRMEQLRASCAELAQRRHGVELEEVRAVQAYAQASSRRAQIERELAAIGAERAAEAEALGAAASTLDATEQRLASLEGTLAQAQRDYRGVDEQLGQAREHAADTERRARDSVFEARSAGARIAELETACAAAHEAIERARHGLGEAEQEAATFDETPIAGRMSAALSARQACEQRLAGLRDGLAEAEAALRGAQQQRLAVEQGLEPLRNRLGEQRLKEQEARLAEENFAQQLAEANADEAALAEALPGAPRPGTLQGDIGRLNEQLAALGAVNLAALEELGNARERSRFLDAQSADLTEAMNTLEDAIRRIDRETRERLQATFEAVNRNLAELFPVLFGGGEARLVMTGEEILDAGVQIVARPPGKKNASIHLLSGGEKALTAMSLVFSLFRLNPAPFCLLDEVDAPLDDSNTVRFCDLVRTMSDHTQFIFISHNKITMELARQLVGVTMAEPGVSRVVAVDMEEALRMRDEKAVA